MEAIIILLLLLIFLIIILAPPNDLAFRNRVKFLPGPMFLISQGVGNLAAAVAGDLFWGVVLVAAVFWWLYRRGQLLLALVLQASIFPICAIYANLWHQGIFVLALLFPMLLAVQAEPAPKRKAGTWRGYAGTTALAILAILQMSGTIHAYGWDLWQPYSGSRQIATLLRNPVARGDKIVAMGFSSLAVQPYFYRNIYSNYHLADGGAYWSWGRPSPLYYALSKEIVPADMVTWAKDQLKTNPEWIVVSAKFRSESLYTETINQSGQYRQVAVAPGRMIWKEDPEEMESFILFERWAPASPPNHLQ